MTDEAVGEGFSEPGHVRRAPNDGSQQALQPGGESPGRSQNECEGPEVDMPTHTGQHREASMAADPWVLANMSKIRDTVMNQVFRALWAKIRYLDSF